MTRRNITWALLLASFAFASGVLLDRKVLAPKRFSRTANAPAAADSLPPMPKVTPRQAAPQSPKREGKMSLADAEAALDALRANTRSIHYYESVASHSVGIPDK